MQFYPWNMDVLVFLDFSAQPMAKSEANPSKGMIDNQTHRLRRGDK